MTPPSLNARQQYLLRALVRFTQLGQLKDPFVPIPVGIPSTEFVIILRGEQNFRFKYISDLDVLCDAGLLHYRWDRRGTGKLYSLSKAAQTAVSHPSVTNSPATINLHDLIQVMSGGTLDIATPHHHTQLAQIAHNAIERHTQVRNLITQLLQTVRHSLPTAAFIQYEKTAQQFEDELHKPQPDAQQIQHLLQTLSLLNHTPINLTEITRVWIYLYPLLCIAATRTTSKLSR